MKSSNVLNTGNLPNSTAGGILHPPAFSPFISCQRRYVDMATKGILYNIQRMSLHDGPGLRTTVFFKGCPLRCIWCSNPESQSAVPQLMYFADLCSGCGHCAAICTHGAVLEREHRFPRDFSRCVGCGACAAECPTTAASMSGREYEVEEVMEIIRRDASFYSNSGGGITFGGGECTMKGDFLTELLTACLNEGLHTCLDTCGQTDPVLFQRLLEMADLFLFDVKHMDSVQHKSLTGVGNERILGNLRTALEHYPEKIRIRIPLMPGLNDSEENITALAAFLKQYGVHHVDILPCHFFGKNKYAALGRPQPPVREYTPDELHDVLRRFAAHNLKAEIE